MIDGLVAGPCKRKASAAGVVDPWWPPHLPVASNIRPPQKKKRRHHRIQIEACEQGLLAPSLAAQPATAPAGTSLQELPWRSESERVREALQLGAIEPSNRLLPGQPQPRASAPLAEATATVPATVPATAVTDQTGFVDAGKLRCAFADIGEKGLPVGFESYYRAQVAWHPRADGLQLGWHCSVRHQSPAYDHLVACAQGIVPEGDWPEFAAALGRDLPCTFRLTGADAAAPELRR